VVSDGSFVDLFASAAFIVEGPTKKGQVTGSIIATGRPTDMSAYRGGINWPIYDNCGSKHNLQNT
jgi:hypothetical protein